MTACVFKPRACVIGVCARAGRRARGKKGKTCGSVLTSFLHYPQFGLHSSFVHKAFVTRVCACDETQLLFTHSSWTTMLLLFWSRLRVSWERTSVMSHNDIKKVPISSWVVFNVRENLKKVKNEGKLIIEKNPCFAVRSTEPWWILYLSVMAAFSQSLQKIYIPLPEIRLLLKRSVFLLKMIPSFF